MKVEKRNKPGHPSKLEVIDFEQVKDLAAQGLTNEQIAEKLGICVATVYNLKNSSKEFLEALKDGKSISDALVEKSLFEKAIGYSHAEDKIFCHEGKILIQPTIKYYPPDTVACIFWLKNRKPAEWREKLELSGTLNIQEAEAKKRLEQETKEYLGGLLRVV